jgi:LAO/AO transport system kinase
VPPSLAAPLSLEALREGGKPALARALAALERRPDDPGLVALLDRAWAEGAGHVVGLTGPPGVGKSSLIARLIAVWRGQGRSVGVVAVDPSSRRTGGARLGDRARLSTDPDDAGLFVRSMAARDRLGGLATLTMPAVTLMAALFDVALVETVGVGQSETDVAAIADTVVFCVQPGSGDSLQFMKAGIVEVPHIAVVTKADVGQAARRARGDLRGALSLAEADADADGWTLPILLVSAETGDGVAELVDAIDGHAAALHVGGCWRARRDARADQWLAEAVRDRFGRDGLARAGARLATGGGAPFAREAAIAVFLAGRASRTEGTEGA